MAWVICLTISGFTYVSNYSGQAPVTESTKYPERPHALAHGNEEHSPQPNNYGQVAPSCRKWSRTPREWFFVSLCWLPVTHRPSHRPSGMFLGVKVKGIHLSNLLRHGHVPGKNSGLLAQLCFHLFLSCFVVCFVLFLTFEIFIIFEVVSLASGSNSMNYSPDFTELTMRRRKFSESYFVFPSLMS